MFWLMPLNFALPSYLVIALVAVWRYWLVAKSMRKPVQDGFQSLVGMKAEVVSRVRPEHSAKYLVRSQGELWSAYTSDNLQPGDQVNIVALKGIGLVVAPAESRPHPPAK